MNTLPDWFLALLGLLCFFAGFMVSTVIHRGTIDLHAERVEELEEEVERLKEDKK